MSSCPDAEMLARHAEGSLPGEDAERVRAHVDGCAACRELLVTLVRTSHPSPGPAPDAPWDVPVPGTMLGRYRVTGTRGAGGMGVVLSAYDPQLDRQVALKVLRPDLDTASSEKSKLSLVREAQLMARVRHPNVVTVHDVVVEGERVVIAMELVEGQTLRDWLEATPRAPEDVLARFVQAGRGLAAAHAAGVVHRDFKPDNVLLDARGQVLVSDFGLAWSEAVPPLPAARGRSPSEQPHTSTFVPRDGARGLASRAVGTPAYMAPEQQAHGPVDARADQFSFCVALWEALQGERPFDAGGAPRAPRQRLRRGVEEALRKGLATSPAERHPDLETLLAALERPPSVARWWPIAALLVFTAVGAAWAWRERSARCVGPRQALAAAWTTARRGAVLDKLGQNGAELGERVDALVAALSSSWDEACSGGDERLRTCLTARIDAVDVTTTALTQAPPDLRVSSSLVARLEGAEGCLAGEVLTLLPVTAGHEAQARQARVEALTADALRFSGDLGRAEATARTAIETARASTWRPAEAEARLALAQVHRARGRFKEAEAELADALLAAEAGRHFEALARVAVQHILVVGTQTNRPDEAGPWVKRAEAALEQLPRPRLRAEVDVALTMLRVSQGRFDEAMALSERALGWLSPRDPFATADLRALRALNLLQFGLDGRARAEADAAAEARVRLLGAAHPLSLHARLTQGEASARTGHVKRALEQLTQALDEARASKQLSPVAVASGLAGLSVALDLGGQPGEALHAARQADELVRGAVGERHRYAALSLRNVGERLASLGRDAEAFAALEEAIALGAAAVGPLHRETLETRARRALLWARRGKPEAADEVEALLELARPEHGRALLVPLRLALATLPGATEAQRAEALLVAREVRGDVHPDVARALQLQGDRDALDAQLRVMDLDPGSL